MDTAPRMSPAHHIVTYTIINEPPLVILVCDWKTKPETTAKLWYLLLEPDFLTPRPPC